VRAGQTPLEFGQINTNGQVVTEDVIRAKIRGKAEPVAGERGQDFALVGDGGGQDDIVSGDTVGRDEPDFLTACVNIAHFAIA